MRPEQRLFLAFGLTLGVLLAWSWLMPTPPIPGPEQPVRPEPGLPATRAPGRQAGLAPSSPVAEETLRASDRDAAEDAPVGFVLGPFSLGVGAQKGGVKILRADGVQLLAESNVGIMEAESLEGTPGAIAFTTRLEEGVLLSEASIGPHGITVERRLSPPEPGHDFLMKCLWRIHNRSLEEQSVRLRMVAYRPLAAKTPEEVRYTEGIASIEDKSHNLRLKSGQQLRFEGSPAWITSQGKSHALIVQPLVPVGMFHVEHLPEERIVGWLELPKVAVPPGGNQEWEFQIYAGPMALTILQAAGMEDKISFGAFSGLAKFLIRLLNFSHSLFHSYGVAIVFLSVAVWLPFLPVTWAGARMMVVMPKLQPQLDRIKREHAKNPQRMMKEQAELFRKHRINPLAGCLPYLFQIPIFIALFQVLSRSYELRGSRFLWMRDLSAPDALIRFPAPMPILGSSFNLLPILMVAAMLFQSKLTAASRVALTEEQRVQQKVFQWMPLIFGVMFYQLPAGLVLYWIVNTILTVTQQLLIVRAHRDFDVG